MTGHVVGETDRKSGDIAINLTLLYELCEDEDEFIKLFSTILIHEQIHRELDSILRRNGITKKERFENLYTGEEVIVRLLCEQDFNRSERKQYARIQNSNKRRKRSKRMVQSKRKGVRL